MPKETSLYGKRDILTLLAHPQKKPTPTSTPEVCVSVKRGLPYGKRDLLHAQKKPTGNSTPEVHQARKQSVDDAHTLQGVRYHDALPQLRLIYVYGDI